MASIGRSTAESADSDTATEPGGIIHHVLALTTVPGTNKV